MMMIDGWTEVVLFSMLEKDREIPELRRRRALHHSQA